jgi:tetratricopeptide (TPR) repeat protein
VLLPLALLVLFIAIAVALRRRHPVVTFAIAWFFLTLLPSSSIIPLRDAAFEHRMYLPLFGLALLTVVGGFDLTAWIAARVGLPRSNVARIGAGLALLWIVLLGGLTLRRNEVYADPLRLAQDSAAKAPGNWRPNYEVAFELLQRNRVDEAVAPLERAIQLDPESGSPRIQLGEIYARQGRYDEAIALLRPATHVEEESVRAAAHRQIGLIYLAKNDPSNAISELEEAARLKPTWASLHEQLAQIFVDTGMWYPAAGRYQRLFELKPRQPPSVLARAAEANYRAALAFLHEGKPQPAIKLLNSALKYRPTYAEARHYLAICYAADGQWDKAQAEIDRLARELPADLVIAENARRIHERQLPLDPGSPYGRGA